MATFKKLTLFLILYIFLQSTECKRKKRQDDLSESQSLFLENTVIVAFNNVVLGKATAPDKVQIIMDKQLENIKTSKIIYSLSQDIAVAAEDAPELTALVLAMQKLPQYFNKIDNLFNQYKTYEQSGKNATDHSLLQFVTESNSLYRGPLDVINNIYSIALPQNPYSMDDYSVLSLLTRKMKGYSRMCNKFKSQQQMLQSLLNTIEVADIKAYFIIEFANRKLAEVGKVDYDSEMNDLRKQIEKTTSYQQFMNAASREIWRCDPSTYVEGENYFQMYLFKSYVIRDSEINRNDDCYYQCVGYQGQYKADQTSCTNSHEYFDNDVDYYEYGICTEARYCSGALYDCEDRFASYSELWICPSLDNSTRRYEFMQHGSINRFLGTRDIRQYGRSGDKKSCERKITYDTRYYGSHFHDLYRNCEICLCTCEEGRTLRSDRVGIRPVVADENHVVVGARWVKKDGLLILQIKQGKILPGGKIDVATIHWKEAERPRSRVIYLDQAYLSWLEFRGILLQDFEVPEGNVLAGIKLSSVQNGPMKLITLQILPLPYNYTTGEVKYKVPFYNNPDESVNMSVWQPLPKFNNPLTESDAVDLTDNQVPTETDRPSVPEPSSKKYVLLTTSDFKTDLGQNTIPFFDMQENVVNPPIPLAGLGIYLKKREKYGGFLGLKLITYDFSHHVKLRI